MAMKTQKRIILLLDGTWNDSDIGPADTNIVRMRDIIASSLDVGFRRVAGNASALTAAPNQKLVTGRTFEGKTEHLVFYERGVGTGPFLDRIKGGSFGDGLAGNIRRAYKFLSYFYEPGDQLFIFGFSRGAYTARSLVGYIFAAGLLTRDNCTPELELKAWDYYRTSPNDRLPGVWSQLTPFVHDRKKLRVDCLGVFETVGALGVPLPQFYRVNRERYEFHDVDLASITNVNLHAIAVDEHRQPFEASVWRKPKFKSYATVTEQVWFAGAHADIGGGYIEQEKRVSADLKALDDISLGWMFKRLLNYFPDFPVESSCWKDADSSWALAAQHEPRKGIYRLFPYSLRSIANDKAGSRKWLHEAEVCRDRHAERISELVHISVIERWGKPLGVRFWSRRYAPRNLQAVLDTIENTYATQKILPPEQEIRIVDWTSRALDPNVAIDRTRATKMLGEAKGRLDWSH